MNVLTKKYHQDLILQWPAAGGILYLSNMPLEEITRGFLPHALTLFSGYLFFSGSQRISSSVLLPPVRPGFQVLPAPLLIIMFNLSHSERHKYLQAT